MSKLQLLSPRKWFPAALCAAVSAFGAPAAFATGSANPSSCHSSCPDAHGHAPACTSWVAGDFHQHTTYTDGANPFETVMYYNDYFGLDWWANSEHGGAFPRDAFGPILQEKFDTAQYARFWDDTDAYDPSPLAGDPAGSSSGHLNMWRWQSLSEHSFNNVLLARRLFHKPIVQGVEWNVPGHEHCSVGIIAGEFGESPNADAIASFEYLWDANDKDTSLGPKNLVNNHAKAVAAVAWLQANHPRTSWTVYSHVERKGPGDPTYVGSGSRGYDIADFRDLNNAGPDVAFGFESMPGHQKESGRGGYGSNSIGGGTFGGCGAYAAKVGYLWDALLGEGRPWWLFASSDFHNTGGDFWPGEYQKTHTCVRNPRDPQAIVDGLRSGNGFVTEGDLIDGLEFSVSVTPGRGSATLGETLHAQSGRKVQVTVRFHSPERNNNGDTVAVDHVDVISGRITGYVQPGDADYNNPVNPTAHVLRRLTPGDWRTDRSGWKTACFEIRAKESFYLRLRGTNNAINNAAEVDASVSAYNGQVNYDPALDPAGNTAADAWKDLWFYSNAIFVEVK